MKNICIIVVGFIMCSCRLQDVRMESTSMEPTIKKGEVISINKIDSIKRDEIVAFNPIESTNNQLWIFRVVGEPGDVIEMNEGIFYVNGKRYNYNFKYNVIWNRGVYQKDFLGSSPSNGWNQDNFGPIKIPKVGEKVSSKEFNITMVQKFINKDSIINKQLFFLLGDNRNDSYDSRFTGYVIQDQIKGVVYKKD